MILQRIAGLVLLVLASAAFAMTSKTLALPVGLCVLAGIGVASRVAIKLPVRPLLAEVLLALVFMTIQRIGPFDNPAVQGFVFYSIAYPLGQFLLTWLALQFIIRQPAGGLPASLPIYAIGAIICAGDVLLFPAQELYYQCLAVAIAATSVLFFVCSQKICQSNIRTRLHPVRLTILLLTVVACVAASWVSIGLVRRHENDLNLLFERIVRLRSRASDIGFDSANQVGFSQNAKLQSVNNIKKSSQAEVMLRVFSQARPGYLRAIVYDNYSDSQWKTSAATWTASPTTGGGIELPGPGQVFTLTALPAGNNDLRRLDVWASPTIAGPIFAPLGTCVIKAPADELAVNGHQAVRSPQLAGGLNYCLLAPLEDRQSTGVEVAGQPASPIGDDMTAKCLQLPPNIDKAVVSLAKELFAGCDTPASRIAAVEHYFRDNYEYSLNMTVPAGMDPLTYFIINKPPAHCEFFASAAAVLLRLGGVPARYVTGFVADTQNGYGGYWLATGNDAHAWVEAWDDTPSATSPAGQASQTSQAGRWVTVEATPSAGVPQSASPAWWQSLWDFIRLRLLQLRVAIELDGFKGLLVWLWDQLAGLAVLLTTTLPGLALLAMAAGAWVWRYRRRIAGKRRVKLSPEILRQHRLLARMDRRASRAGLVRHQAETLHQFAARIRSQSLAAADAQTMAKWYEDYAATRYGTID
jgi:hypothetical protein